MINNNSFERIKFVVQCCKDFASTSYKELRDLQTKINKTIVSIQNLTAKP